MKLIKAYIRTNMIDKVIYALEASDFTNMTVVDVKRFEREMRAYVDRAYSRYWPPPPTPPVP